MSHVPHNLLKFLIYESVFDVQLLGVQFGPPTRGQVLYRLKYLFLKVALLPFAQVLHSIIAPALGPIPMPGVSYYWLVLFELVAHLHSPVDASASQFIFVRIMAHASRQQRNERVWEKRNYIEVPYL
ncbi:uncharacterized protein LACBIDRAFT_296018 [Laccaria bicolor S238N-H82]|uniref:Predicted protein n=1 Tax=Laccaria bicolor (strain S238N-H82 / ATCC MYA-4686) TaxID=486041 RepID=B0E1Y0_LACBS|nr:uncharacterized protein LACBIDRAFT_296018 [Laccaria bicolor S238N-H82]EDQ99144.1 predicted protein [Laccaria bicolor S238N-H82]|eukprot:XP_001890207.1 predicted protein [Laccaria bicolor S238N-H82]